MSIPRPEYPRPGAVREKWMNLNGAWDYITDNGNSGYARGLAEGKTEDFKGKITVPFCRESVLSGIGDIDYCFTSWYRREVEFPGDWLENGNRVLLHVGACDYRADVFVNGKLAGTHTGGYSSFTVDLTDFLADGKGLLAIHAEDYSKDDHQPRGKQSGNYASAGCFYTRTTGIWQTVWCECVPAAHIVTTKFYPDIHKKTLCAEVFTCGAVDGLTVKATATYHGKTVGMDTAVIEKSRAVLTIALDELHLWDVGKPELYDLVLTVGDDTLTSYFGMRSIGLVDGILYLNDRPVFQRLVLDQGFYPDGIYTAPTDEALKGDILRSMEMGFNGARLHEKVFEERFLYYCDTLGYIVWGEFPNWGANIGADYGWGSILPEWLEVLKRDFNHPAIIGWCPLNETQPNTQDSFTRMLAGLTRAYDPTRLYIDASGWVHSDGVTDIYDLHCYEQDPEKFRKEWLEPNGGENTPDLHCLNPGQPCRKPFTFVSEYGGTWWAPEAGEAGWGYGETPKAPDEVVARFRGLTEALLNDPKMGGLCYTQLTDVEQEKNGLYTYDRQPKFDPETIAAILRQPAAIEKKA